MRRSLFWALAATGAASIVALWTDDPQVGSPSIVATRADGRASRWSPSPADAGPAPAPAPAADPSRDVPLPAELPLRDSDAGHRDLFRPVQPPPPPPAPAPPPPPPPPPPPAPEPPSLQWSAVGVMRTPTGERIVWLSRGRNEVRVNAGSRLDDGFVVTRIDATTITLAYPPLGWTTTLDLPLETRGN